MSCNTDKNTINSACSGCPNNCKNKKSENKIKLLPVQTQKKKQF